MVQCTSSYTSFTEFLVVRDENVTNLKRHKHCADNLWGIMQEHMWVSGGKYPLIFKIGTRHKWVVATPWHYTAGNRASGTLLIRDWLGPRASPDVFLEEKNLVHLSRIERRLLSRSACSLVTILTMLPWLPNINKTPCILRKFWQCWLRYREVIRNFVASYVNGATEARDRH